MKPDIVIADFSGTLEAQGFLSYLDGKGLPFRRVGMEDVEGTGCYCDPEAESEIRRRLEPFRAARIRWIDSGDYHYVTKILAEFQKEPFVLVLIDNHPDDQEPAFGGDVLSCGSWVKAMREGNPFLEEVWTLGPDRRIRNASGTVDRELEEEIGDLVAALKGHRVYLSVDKDVLRWEESRTDWSQGNYSLRQIKGWLEPLLKGQEIVAVDLCGELSPAKGATPEDLRINLNTNIDLQEFILSCLNR